MSSSSISSFPDEARHYVIEGLTPDEVSEKINRLHQETEIYDTSRIYKDTEAESIIEEGDVKADVWYNEEELDEDIDSLLGNDGEDDEEGIPL